MDSLQKVSSTLKDYFNGIYKQSINYSSDLSPNERTIFVNSPTYNYFGGFGSRQNSNSNKAGLIIFLFLLPVLLISGVISFAFDDYVNYLLSGINHKMKKLEDSHVDIKNHYKKWRKMFLRRSFISFSLKIGLFTGLILLLSGLCFDYNMITILGYVMSLGSVLILLWRYLTHRLTEETTHYIKMFRLVDSKLITINMNNNLNNFFA